MSSDAFPAFCCEMKDGETDWKEITLPADGEPVCGVYGEDNRPQ